MGGYMWKVGSGDYGINEGGTLGREMQLEGNWTWEGLTEVRGGGRGTVEGGGSLKLLRQTGVFQGPTQVGCKGDPRNNESKSWEGSVRNSSKTAKEPREGEEGKGARSRRRGEVDILKTGGILHRSVQAKREPMISDW